MLSLIVPKWASLVVYAGWCGVLTKYKSNIVSMAQLITGDERVLAMTGERTEWCYIFIISNTLLPWQLLQLHCTHIIHEVSQQWLCRVTENIQLAPVTRNHYQCSVLIIMVMFPRHSWGHFMENIYETPWSLFLLVLVHGSVLIIFHLIYLHNNFWREIFYWL